MAYSCLQVSFNFCLWTFTKISTLANSKNFENVFLNKGKEIPIVYLNADWIHIKTIGTLF